MTVSTITLFGGKRGQGLRPLQQRILKIKHNLGKLRGKGGQEFLSALDVLVSSDMVRNFRVNQKRGWKKISPFTMIFERKKLPRGKASSWNDLVTMANKLPPLEDTGRLLRSIHPKSKTNSGDHILRVRGNAIEIGTRAPGAAKNALGKSVTFSNSISWVRPGRRKVKGSGRPAKQTKDDARLRKVLDKPSKENGYFANKLRWHLHNRGQVTKKLPVRSWFRVYADTLRKIGSLVARTMVKK